MPVDATFLRALFLARLSECTRALTPALIADIVIAVVAEAGLIAADAAAAAALTSGQPASRAQVVIAETLRVNAPRTHSFLVLAEAVLDALALNGFDYTSTPPDHAVPKLSKAQIRVLTLAAEGLSYDEIAAVAKLSKFTVGTHFEHIRAKLGARNTLHAVVIARDLGLLGGRRAMAAAA